MMQTWKVSFLGPRIEWQSRENRTRYAGCEARWKVRSLSPKISSHQGWKMLNHQGWVNNKSWLQSIWIKNWSKKGKAWSGKSPQGTMPISGKEAIGVDGHLTKPDTIHHWHGYRVNTPASLTFLLKFLSQSSQSRPLHLPFPLPIYTPTLSLFFQTQSNTSGNPWIPWQDHPDTCCYRITNFLFRVLFTFAA